MGYMAPYLMNEPLSIKAGIWSLYIILNMPSPLIYMHTHGWIILCIVWQLSYVMLNPKLMWSNNHEHHTWITSTVYWCITSKLKVPLIFYGMNKTFLWVDSSLFNQSYSGGITMTKKPTRFWRYYHSRCWPPCCHGRRHGAWSPTPWAMSLYFKFRAVYFWLLNEYHWWDQAKIYHIIRKLSYRFICEIMTWSGDKTKLIHKNISTRIRLQALRP